MSITRVDLPEIDDIFSSSKRIGHVSRLFFSPSKGPFSKILSFLHSCDILNSVCHVNSKFHIASLEALTGRKEFNLNKFFFEAVESSYYKSVYYMIYRNIIDERMEDQKSLEIASELCDLKMIRLLLSRKRVRFDNMVEELNDIPMLTMSIRKRNFPLFQTLVLYENIIFSYNSHLPLRLVIDYSLTKYLEIMLKNPKFDPSECQQYAVRTICANTECEDIDSFLLLLADERCDPTYNDNIFLRDCTKRKHHRILEVLLKDDRVEASPERIREIMEIAHKQSDWTSLKIIANHYQNLTDDEYIANMSNMIKHPLYKICEKFSIAFVALFVCFWIWMIVYFIVGIIGFVTVIFYTSLTVILVYAGVFIASMALMICVGLVSFGIVGGVARSYYQSKRWRFEHEPFSVV